MNVDNWAQASQIRISLNGSDNVQPCPTSPKLAFECPNQKHHMVLICVADREPYAIALLFAGRGQVRVFSAPRALAFSLPPRRKIRCPGGGFFLSRATENAPCNRACRCRNSAP